MAYKGKQSYQPEINAGIGLIYRLNALWNRADFAALEGDMEKWNFVLDTIYRNLLYRNNMEIEYTLDKEGRPKEITKVGLMREDMMIYENFRAKLRKIKQKKIEAIKKKDRNQYNFQSEELYRSLMLKDIWLRKFMQDRGLYLKEVEFNPANAMWGG
jgi:hypothetical protein